MAKIFTITEGLENMGALRTGGQGSVYKTKRTGTLITAVKVLPTPIHVESMDDKNFADFNNEVEKLKKVNETPSPNIVKILRSGLTESGSLPFIEMEYIDGPDLEDLLKPPHNPIFSVRELSKVIQQLAGALAHCHSVGVKHGDIKSNNVKYNSTTGNYVLLDFGLSLMSDEQRRSSRRNAGAVEFMAPEQYEGRLLFETDIYSFGMVIYELIAGSVPFPLIKKTDSSRNAVMLAHMEVAPPDMMALRKINIPSDWPPERKEREMQVPTWILRMVEQCIEKTPEKRFSNGIDLQESVSSALEGNHYKTKVSDELEQYKARCSELTIKIRNNQKKNVLYRFFFFSFGLVLALSIMKISDTFDSRGSGKTTTRKDSAQEAVNRRPGIKIDSGVSGTDIQKSNPKPVNSEADSNRRIKKTKDGLIDDVPYF